MSVPVKACVFWLAVAPVTPIPLATAPAVGLFQELQASAAGAAAVEKAHKKKRRKDRKKRGGKVAGKAQGTLPLWHLHASLVPYT